MWSGILVAYGEIALKSDFVRRSYVRKLMKNIVIGMEREGLKYKIMHRWSRVFIETEDIEKSLSVLSRIFGVAYYSPYMYVNLYELENFIYQNCAEFFHGVNTFAVRVRRSGQHDFTSKDLENKLGSIIKEKTGLKVSLGNPERTLYVEVRNNECYIYYDKYNGLRGIPLGTSGRVICLVSSGIDSPVASWLMMKRGCPIIILYADMNYEYRLKNLANIVKRINYWHTGEDLSTYIYDHYKWLQEISGKSGKYTCILCKIMMYKVANYLAKNLGAWAIVTGESLGQVASQTSQNLMILDSYSELPVIRPLISFDKDEIVSLSRKLGFYEYSIQGDDYVSASIGCWARPKHVATKANPNIISKMLLELNFESLFDECIKSIRKLFLNN